MRPLSDGRSLSSTLIEMQIATIPNLLSLSRIVFVPALIVTLAYRIELLAVSIFCVVVISDFLDGIIARRSSTPSARGALIDHGSDAIFVSAMTAYFAYLGVLPLILPALIAIAFIQYSIDSGKQANTGLRASRIGRWNGIAYFAITGLAVAVYLFAVDSVFRDILNLFAYLLCASTVVSIISRAARFFSRARKS
ncbi:MAG: CDP-alcohol phosphatidyltransferase family protein [Proteobacteria bacterium]|nr:CDP-alcohol phosphatidyltransferase family protein [Pseudomonadota bacterium]